MCLFVRHMLTPLSLYLITCKLRSYSHLKLVWEKLTKASARKSLKLCSGQLCCLYHLELNYQVTIDGAASLQIKPYPVRSIRAASEFLNTDSCRLEDKSAIVKHPCLHLEADRNTLNLMEHIYIWCCAVSAAGPVSVNNYYYHLNRKAK